MTKKHHPSCTEHDKDLVWHCSQCGLNELADEQEIINRAQSEDKARANLLLNLGAELFDAYIEENGGDMPTNDEHPAHKMREAIDAARKHKA